MKIKLHNSLAKYIGHRQFLLKDLWISYSRKGKRIGRHVVREDIDEFCNDRIYWAINYSQKKMYALPVIGNVVPTMPKTVIDIEEKMD